MLHCLLGLFSMPTHSVNLSTCCAGVVVEPDNGNCWEACYNLGYFPITSGSGEALCMWEEDDGATFYGRLHGFHHTPQRRQTCWLRPIQRTSALAACGGVCPTCGQHQLACPSSLSAGMYGSSSCDDQDNVMACYFQQNETGFCAPGGYDCGCMKHPDDMVWKPDPSCVTGSSGVATSPAVCRFHKYEDTSQWWMGWISSPDDWCNTARLEFGENGKVLWGLKPIGGGPPYDLQVLCWAPKGEQTCTVHSCLPGAWVCSLMFFYGRGR